MVHFKQNLLYSSQPRSIYKQISGMFQLKISSIKSFPLYFRNFVLYCLLIILFYLSLPLGVSSFLLYYLYLPGIRRCVMSNSFTLSNTFLLSFLPIICVLHSPFSIRVSNFFSSLAIHACNSMVRVNYYSCVKSMFLCIYIFFFIW